MPTSVELREKKFGLSEKVKAYINSAEGEGRDLNTEEKSQVDAIFADIDQLDDRINRMERLERVEATLDTVDERSAPQINSENRNKPVNRGNAEPTEEAKIGAFRHWMKSGEVRNEIRSNTNIAAEYRDTIIGTDAKGGYLIAPVKLANDIIRQLDNFTYLRKVATITKVTDAKALGIRKKTARMASADWTTEVGSVTEDTTMAFGRRDMTPSLLSKLAKVSLRTLLLSSEAETEVRDELAYQFAITEENGFLNGSGSSQPLGMFVASSSGIPASQDVAMSSATTFTFDDLIKAKFTLRQPYIQDKSIAWIVSRPFVRIARTLKDSQNRYLWEPSLVVGEPDKILDIPYMMSEYAPSTFTTGLYIGVLGCMRYYRIAEVTDFLLQRLTELYAGTSEIGFIGRRWVDGAPLLDEAFVRLKLA